MNFRSKGFSRLAHLIVTLALFMLIPTRLALAAPFDVPLTISSQALTGELTTQFGAHYLGLTATERDGIIELTLAYDPQFDLRVTGFVNFLVLTDDGLRRYLAGGDTRTLNIASGSPLQFDPVGNKLYAAFRDSGRGSYTVIVYNNAPQPVQYTLSVQGGTLSDEVGQTQVTGPLTPSPTSTPLVNTPLATTIPLAAPAVTTPATTNGVTARRVSGSLRAKIDRHYLEIFPTLLNGIVSLGFRYDPQESRELFNHVNFLVLDEDGLRRFIQGTPAEELELASGSLKPFSPNPNELIAGFAASGHGPYTAVVYNNAEIPALYVRTAEGALLIDRYGQTNEAKAATLEEAALAGANVTSATLAPTTTATLLPTSSPSPALTVGPGITTSTVSSRMVSTRLAGELKQLYAHHYFGLTPTLLNGEITLLLDYNPKDSQELAGNINFFVLTDDTLRRVINGARPEDVTLATGARVPFGINEGKLWANFTASGHGKYTVIIYNNSGVPAQYLLEVEGGSLEDETQQASLP